MARALSVALTGAPARPGPVPSPRLGRAAARARPSKAIGARRVPQALSAYSPWHSEQPGQEQAHAIFQDGSFGHIDVSVYDARDALETCTGLYGDERSSCFAIFGLNADLTETFFDTVYSLEQSLELDTDPEEEARHSGRERC